MGVRVREIIFVGNYVHSFSHDLSQYFNIYIKVFMLGSQREYLLYIQGMSIVCYFKNYIKTSV